MPPPEADDPTMSVGERGLSCCQFRDLVRFTKRLCRTGLLRYEGHPRKPDGSRILWSEITMYEVCNNVVKPVIAHLSPGGGYSWSTLVNKGKAKRPRIFISHSWQERFDDFVASFEHLQLDRGLTATDAVWICTFANNQFEVVLGKMLDESPFYKALEHAMEVALFIDHNASALSRSWCNFELAVTTDTEWNRNRWAVRQELAGEGGSCFDVDWKEVDKKLLKLSRVFERFYLYFAFRIHKRNISHTIFNQN